MLGCGSGGLSCYVRTSSEYLSVPVPGCGVDESFIVSRAWDLSVCPRGHDMIRPRRRPVGTTLQLHCIYTGASHLKSITFTSRLTATVPRVD